MSYSGLRLYKETYVNKLIISFVLSLIILFTIGYFLISSELRHGNETKQLMEHINSQRIDADLLKLENQKLRDAIQKHEIMVSQVSRIIKSENIGLSDKQADFYARLEIKHSNRKQIPTSIGIALSVVESRYNAKAVSYDGSSFGIKQINLNVWQSKYKFTLNDLKNPEYNIKIGYDMLAMHKKEYGSIEGALKRFRGSTNPATNQEYMVKIVKIAKKYKHIANIS
jgi:soluble lytic murein transglycosylase-like protein